MSTDALRRRLVSAARAVASAGLSDAFGHVSVCTSPATALITPPVPLSSVGSPDSLVEIDLRPGAELPGTAPREGWLHLELLADPATGAVCRAQPPAVAAFAALHVPLPALTGHCAMLGRVAVHEDSRLVRDRTSAQRVAARLGDATAIILRGNGAVTRGADLESAVAAMWVLERSADAALRSLAAGAVHPLPDDEAVWWRERADELLPRIATHLFTTSTQREEHP